MNGSGKQSFYEIQLSNGSLIAAFVVAVAIGVAVFALGVAVGKGQVPASAADSDLVENLAQGNVDDDRPASSDLDFFERVQEPVDGGDESTAATASAQEPTTPATGQEASPARQPTTEAPPTARSADGLPAADLTIATGFVVQVKSTPDREEANGLQAALAGAGFPAFVVSGDVRGQTFYRVRVGRYRAKTDAERVASALSQRSDISDTWVTDG